jgi:chromosome segregation ATPase
MFGKNDSVDDLSHDLDRARGKRDALASEVTTLTTQITEMEARLFETKSRRDRVRVLGEIEATKAQIKQATSEFVPLIGKLCEAIERAAVIVPEARELNGFLLSVAAEVDSVVNPLLRELDQRADAVQSGQAALDLPCSTNEVPIEPPSNNRDWLLRSLLLFSVLLPRIKGLVKNQTTETPRGTAA